MSRKLAVMLAVAFFEVLMPTLPYIVAVATAWWFAPLCVMAALGVGLDWVGEYRP